MGDPGNDGRPEASAEAEKAAHGGKLPEQRLRWEVLGRVQGVGFRWFVRQQARRWGVRGWVRNRDDGSVEIAASAPPAALEGLLAAVRRGPPGADVTDTRVTPAGDDTDFPDPFSILRG